MVLRCSQTKGIIFFVSYYFATLQLLISQEINTQFWDFLQNVVLQMIYVIKLKKNLKINFTYFRTDFAWLHHILYIELFVECLEPNWLARISKIAPTMWGLLSWFSKVHNKSLNSFLSWLFWLEIFPSRRTWLTLVGQYMLGPRHWNVPVLVNTRTFLVCQYCPKMCFLRSKNMLVLSRN